MPSSADDLRSLLNSTPTGNRAGGNNDSTDSPRFSAATANRVRRPADRPSRHEPHGKAGRPLAATLPNRLDHTGISVTDVIDRTRSRELAQSKVGADQVSTPKGPRATSTLQRAWVDPEETPFEPVPRPGNPLAARFISWLVLLAIGGGLAWLIVPELDFRLANLDTVELHDGVLSAQAVPLSPLRPAIVTDLFVDASSLPDGVLAEGTPIALLEGTAQDGLGLDVHEIRVPFDARLVSVDTLVGGVVMPGTPVATIYDPSKMYVIVTVQPGTLDLLKRGMRATLHSDVLGETIEGEVISAVPLLGTDHEPTTSNLVNVRIKPDLAGVADLVPGIRFDATIDLASAAPGAQPLVFTSADHVNVSGTAEKLATNEGISENG